MIGEKNTTGAFVFDRPLAFQYNNNNKQTFC